MKRHSWLSQAWAEALLRRHWIRAFSDGTGNAIAKTKGAPGKSLTQGELLLKSGAGPTAETPLGAGGKALARPARGHAFARMRFNISCAAIGADSGNASCSKADIRVLSRSA